MSAVLDIAHLTVRRGALAVLEDVSLQVRAGSLHVLAGPNGAGKSTLFAAVLGFAEFEGSIRFSFRGSGRVGYVPQRFAVDRTLPLTVAEFLALQRRRLPVCFGLRRAAREEAEALLSRVDLAGFGARPLHALSGGELQRVLLANALDPAPELLLLDEPASGMDDASARRFEELLLALETTVLLISHDLAQAQRIADEITTLSPPRAAAPRRHAGAFAP